MLINKRHTWLFVQLPVVSHDLRENFAHIPYTSSLLSCFLRSVIKNIEVICLDKKVETFGSDSMIIKTIVDIEPDVVCFSLYLWNVERSLYIARKLKQILPDVLVIIGGPEVNLDNEFILNVGGFDIGIIGEGELVLADIASKLEFTKSKLDLANCIADVKVVKQKIFLYGRSIALNKIPLVHMDADCISYDGSILIETIRGCVHNCKYCYYHKNFKKIRYFPLEKVISELKWAWDKSVNEISFIDPSFLRRKDSKLFLNRLHEVLNKSGPYIFCELNAEDVSIELAELLKKINVKKVEVGLQSINEVALRLINRKFNKKDFVSGIKELRKREIDILLDLIVGLPGDGVRDVLKGVDFVLENKLADQFGIYPLCVLPGTELRSESTKLGLDYTNKPPYLVKKTKNMDRAEIKETFVSIEEKIDIDLFPREFPLLFPDESYLSNNVYPIYLLDLQDRGIDINDFALNCLDNLMCSIMIHISDVSWLLNGEKFLRLYNLILSKNPFILIDIIIDDEQIDGLEFEKIVDIFKSVLCARDMYMDKVYVDTIDAVRSTQVFLKLRGQDDNFALVSIPSTIYSTQESTFWFKIYGLEDGCLEEYFLDKFAYVTKIQNFLYRISYAQDCLNLYKSVFPLGKREVSFYGL
ncbi:B12-binding domain-containing radical SAM protein [Desulfothermus sp.]